MYAWGCNGSGQLGLGDFVDRRAPAHVEGLWALPVASLAAGDSHSAALTMNGFLFSWGANDKGQLGLPKNAEAAAQVSMHHVSNLPHQPHVLQSMAKECRAAIRVGL